MVDTGIILLDIRQPMLLKQKRKQELDLFWQLFSALSRGLSHQDIIPTEFRGYEISSACIFNFQILSKPITPIIVSTRVQFFWPFLFLKLPLFYHIAFYP